MATARERKRLFRELDQRDPHFMEKVAPFLEGLYKYYFRCEVQGWQNVPDETAMYVGNHNGMITFEVLMLFYAWWKRFKDARPALGLAHAFVFNNPFFRWLVPRVGAIPASPDIALDALAKDYSLLVFPGGLKESFRPFSERKKIDFFGHQGFLRVALKAKVPVVPIVSIGAHETYVILNRGAWIAQKLGLDKNFRFPGVPLTFRTLFFAWCLASGVFTFFPLLLAPTALFWACIPLPAKMKFRILPPIRVHDLVDPKLSEEENLQKLYDRVVGQMQAVLTEEYSKRKLPVVG